MKVVRFINSIFTSNSYIIYSQECDTAFVIDPGDSKFIINWLKSNNKILKGILITHSHFDHIYGINELQHTFPEIYVYGSFYAKEGLMCEKLNGSLYMEMPFIVKPKDMIIIKEGDCIPLWNDVTVNVFETPGHDRDCLSFQIKRNLFTGDAFIPGIKVHTKSKYSDKIKAEESIKRIFEVFGGDTLIWPGHANNCLLADVMPHSEIKYLL